jgi:hypothetical protein
MDSGEPDAPPPLVYAGPTEGRVCNLYWRSVDEEVLRADLRYSALPELGDVLLAGPPSYRFVR